MGDFVLFAPSSHLSNLSNSRLAVGGVSVTWWPSAASACFLNEKVERQVCGVRKPYDKCATLAEWS